MKILSHFSKTEFKLDLGFDYQNHLAKKRNRKIGKPNGLWLSDESDFGWKDWCEGEEFRLEHLKFRADFAVDLSKIKVLNSDREIENFSQQYQKKLYPEQSDALIMDIDWERIYSEYAGILISPYSWEHRLGDNFWYYGWDCASACVWDLSVLKQLECQEDLQKLNQRVIA